MTSQSPLKHFSRRGITLMEIMISMGIVLVGILGIMALMPLAARNLGEGIQADAASTFGRGVLHQMTSREIGNSDWIVGNFDGSGNPMLFRLEPDATIRSTSSFCFDPLYIAAHAAYVGETNLPRVQNTTVGMPYFGIGGEPAHSHPRMLRATLPLLPTVEGNRLPMISALARQMCQGQDDLVFERLPDVNLPPQQTFSRLDDQSTDTWEFAARVRQSEGRFSWMATIVPEINSGGVVADEFRRLSIVVFHDRIIDPALDPTDVNAEQQELLFDVAFLGGGIAGGDVRLVTRPGRPANDLTEIRQGDWIMLGATVFTPSLPQQFRWYRVIDAAATSVPTQDYNGNDVFTRDVTLVGPDWMRAEWVNYDMNASPVDNYNNGRTRTQATWVRGVVSVLEKNITVDAHDH